MPRRSRKRAASNGVVPVDSVADVAFLLIIYFIIVTTLTQTQGWVQDMPSGEQSESDSLDKTPTVSVHDGTIRFNDDVVELADLRMRLDGLKLTEVEDPDKRVVLVSTTGRTNYQRYFEVTSMISATGGVIGFLEEEEGGDE